MTLLPVERDDTPRDIPFPRPTTVAAGRVVLVEADERLRLFVDRALRATGARVELVANGALAQRAQGLGPADVLILDRELTGLDGARQLRALTPAAILLLAESTPAQSELSDRIAALDAGADDFLRKPFAIEDLLARVRALRRGRVLAAAGARAMSRQGSLEFADVELDLDTRTATRGGRPLELRHKAFELLACFLRHPERVLSRQEILAEVWDYQYLGDSNVIEVTVGHLRQALEAGGEPRLIHTVRPLGYILRPPAAPAAPDVALETQV